MWYALRAELVYFRPWLLGGLGIAVFVSTLMTLLVLFVEDTDGIPGFVVAMFPIIAGMVVAFIAQSYRSEERRSRLLMTGPLTPWQMAGILVLLPACLVWIGAIAGGLWVVLTSLITGPVESSTIQMIAVFAVQFWAYAQMGPLAQEAAAARNQQRPRAAFIGWGMFVAAVLALVASQFFLGSTQGIMAQLMIVVAAMATAAALYPERKDFTR